MFGSIAKIIVNLFRPSNYGEEFCSSNVLRLTIFFFQNHVTYNRSQKFLRQTRKTASYLKPQAIENSFKRVYGEVEDNIIIYIERLKT